MALKVLILSGLGQSPEKCRKYDYWKSIVDICHATPDKMKTDHKFMKYNHLNLNGCSHESAVKYLTSDTSTQALTLIDHN